MRFNERHSSKFYTTQCLAWEKWHKAFGVLLQRLITELPQQAKTYEELRISDFYNKCPRETCPDFSSEWDKHHNCEHVCCGNWRAGYCTKTCKSKLVVLEALVCEGKNHSPKKETKP